MPNLKNTIVANLSMPVLESSRTNNESRQSKPSSKSPVPGASKYDTRSSVQYQATQPTMKNVN